MDPSFLNILGIPAYALLWIATIIAFGIFGRRIVRLVQVLRKGRPEDRFDHIGKRLLRVVTYVLGQKRLLEEPVIGLAHFFIFWGFVVYAGSFGWNLVRGLFPFMTIPYADEVGAVRLILEIFAAVVLIAVAVAVTRRLFFAPPHLQKSGDATLILSLIAALMVTFLLGQEFRIAAEGEESSTARELYASMFLLHQGIVLFFLAYLPHSKHMHLLASPFNVFFSDVQPAGAFSGDGAAGDASPGAARWSEFTWKQLLSAFACAECGRCDRACSALNSGASLSPRLLIHHLKEELLETGLAGKPAGNGDGQVKLLGGRVSAEDVWQCVTCRSCMDRCPVMNEHLPMIVNMRRRLVNEGSVDRPLQETLMKLSRYGNSFGKSERMRGKWTEGLGFTIKDARKEPVEYLWFVGDFASYDPRVQDITRLTARIFQNVGLDFGILYEGERNAGNDIRRVGEEGLFESLRVKNHQAMAKARFEKVVTTDPHTYNTLKNEYYAADRSTPDEVSPTNGGGQVLHHTALFERLIESGRLSIKRELKSAVTYQDPCYLGRYNGVYREPREVLRWLGVTVKEMPRNRSQSYCCGAGGGRIWMSDSTSDGGRSGTASHQVTEGENSPGNRERPSESRIREAAALRGVRTLVTACPKDIVMFRDAIKTTGNEGKMEVKDISELVWEAMEPA